MATLPWIQGGGISQGGSQVSFLLQNKDDGQCQQSLELCAHVCSGKSSMGQPPSTVGVGAGWKAERQDGVGEGE